MLKKVVGVCFAFGMLSACDAPNAQITTRPVVPNYTSASKGLKANAINSLEVRTFAQTRNTREEVVGVPCKLSTQYYTANVVTPAIVQLPSYAEKTPSVAFECTHNGKKIKQNREPYNETVQNRTTSVGGGLLVLAIVAATTKAENSVFSYGNFWMNFNEE